MPKNILIADSGSTKTDWVLVSEKRKRSFATQGLNPYLQTAEDMLQILHKELKIKSDAANVDAVYFYGAGINNRNSEKLVINALQSFFETKKIAAASDLLASARATCVEGKGIACILGTGSNSCYYDGKRIKSKLPSLGYVLGDEGSGNHIGRRLLQHYFQGIMDQELASAFEEMYDVQLENVLQNVYRKPFANRYLAKFAKFALAHRGHYLIENIVEDCLNEFFMNNLLHYKQIHKVPLHFSGSVAYYFQDIISQLCQQYEINLGVIIQRPINELVAYHKKEG